MLFGEDDQKVVEAHLGYRRKRTAACWPGTCMIAPGVVHDAVWR
jgi:hypothetical protein